MATVFTVIGVLAVIALALWIGLYVLLRPTVERLERRGTNGPSSDV